MAEYQLKFAGKKHLTSDIWRFDFDKPMDLKFTAGQFMEYTLPHDNMDDRGDKRWFTISAAPDESVISITTRIFAKMSTFKHALNTLTVGATIAAKGPDGDFVLPDNSPAQPVVLIAGGIGVTPYHSQIQGLLDVTSESKIRPITLIYGAKTVADFVYSDVFEQAAQKWPDFHLIRVLSTPDTAWHEAIGQITDELIKKSTADIAATAIYVSGPEPMVEAFKPRLLALGFADAYIHQDWFPGYSEHF